MNSEFTQPSALSIQIAKSPSRRGYLDCLRGLAVLIMIEAHLLDSWTRFPDRQTATVRLGDGPRRVRRAAVSVSRRRRGPAVRRLEAPADRRRRTRHRAPSRGAASRSSGSPSCSGFRPGSSAGQRRGRLLKVDILNIMGPSIMAAAAIWGAARHARRAGLRGVRRRTLAVDAPHADRAQHLDPLGHCPIRSRPTPARSAGSATSCSSRGRASSSPGRIGGLVLDAARSTRRRSSAGESGVCAHRQRHRARRLRAVVPSDSYPQSQFWTTSPAFFFLRVGIMTAAIGLLRLGPAARRRAELESARAARPNVAVHLLDSRRDGLRPHLAAAAQAPVVGASWMALALFCLLHAALLAGQGRVVER